MLTVSDSACVAVTCWDHQFDPILEHLDKPQVEKVLRRLHPAWFECVDNAVRERYGDGALLEFLDPDVMNRKWMIGVMFSYLADDKDAAAAVAVDKVLTLSLRVFEESSNKPSKLDYVRAAAAGAAQGGARGWAATAQIRGAAQWLSAMGS